jgi:hypothetical protein
MAATMSTQMWIQSARDELREDLPRKDLTRHQLVQEIPETWYCHVPMDLSRELPLCGSWTYASPEINLVIADILTGDQALAQQMFDIIEEVDNLEKLKGGNGMFGGDGDWCWPLDSYGEEASNFKFRETEKDVFAWLDDLELISDMEEFLTENQIEECLDYIENVDDDFDPGIESALLQFEEDFDYEKSLYEENKACEKQQINLHRLLAQEPIKRPHWAGQADSEFVDDFRLEPPSPYQTDRFTLDVEMITNFPEGKQGGYALGKTPYGMVYFPSKFRGFVKKAYHDDQGALYHTGWYSVTVALRDAASRENDRVKSVFTAVYNHGDLE